MEAEQLVRFVNELFTPLADEILVHRGTIDKFMGDAVMAFWNAPLSDPEHARLACRAALAMQTAVGKINQKRDGDAEPIRLGIGVNTGTCVVGNVGSPQRFDYSVLGDVVNTAARLEETTKSYGVPIILGETTAAAVKDFAVIEIGTAALRGKDRPVKLYALAGDETVAQHARFADLERSWKTYVEAMSSSDLSRARNHLLAGRALEIEGADPVIEAALSRLPG
jgi:adenylate cyclase